MAEVTLGKLDHSCWSFMQSSSEFQERFYGLFILSFIPCPSIKIALLIHSLCQILCFPNRRHRFALSHLSALIPLGHKGTCKQDGCPGLGAQTLAVERCFFFVHMLIDLY